MQNPGKYAAKSAFGGFYAIDIRPLPDIIRLKYKCPFKIAGGCLSEAGKLFCRNVMFFPIFAP